MMLLLARSADFLLKDLINLNLVLIVSEPAFQLLKLSLDRLIPNLKLGMLLFQLTQRLVGFNVLELAL